MQVCPTCQAQCDDGQAVCPTDGTPLAGAGLVGRTLGDRYKVLGRIGQGGMGTVYLCEHVALGKRMAVKVLRPEFSRDEELVRRFQHEARAASQIGQENIVDVYDFGHTPEGLAYFVMEALEGESLARILHREGPLPLGRALRIFQQISRALDAAHRRGIVHRDLKPENVFVLRRADGSDFVKVLDFGISKSAMSPDAARLTRAGSIIGTPEYMSPEQAAGTGADQRSDIYSLGVLAYEVLTGRLPLEGDTSLATLLKHQSEPPLPLRRHRPELPVEVEAVVMRMLAKRPDARPASMSEVGQLLSAAVAGIDVDARPTPVVPPPIAPRPTTAVRGGTMPLVGIEALSTMALPAAAPPPPEADAETLVMPSPRPRATPDPTAQRRRRTQAVVAVVLGLFGLALVIAVGAAVSLRAPDPSSEPIATVVVEPAPPPTPTGPAPAEATAGEQHLPPLPLAPGATAMEASPAIGPAPPGSAPPRPSRRTPGRARTPGTGADGKGGENRGRATDLIDPYR